MWEGCDFSSYPVACNMSPLGRRRGPALRASIRRRPEGGTTGGSPLCQITARRARLIPQSWPLAEHQGATPFRRPPCGQLTPGPISLERGAIFQHKGHAMLAYLEDRLQVASKMAQDANLTPTWSQLGPSWAQLGPTWPHLGPILSPKRPPRGPKKPDLHHKN